MSIDQQREENIDQLAESRATDDAASRYPLAEESEAVLLACGQHIAREEYRLTADEAVRFASTYVSIYQATIDRLDQDYEPQQDEESVFIAARRSRQTSSTFHLR